MNEKFISKILKEFEKYLLYEVENSNSTTKKYVSEAKKFLIWLCDEMKMSKLKISKELIVNYKEHLKKVYKNHDTINGILGMNHIFLKFLGKGDITVKRLKVVKINCKSSGRYVKEIDYKKLIKCGKKKYTKAVIVAKIIANTGIRASELS